MGFFFGFEFTWQLGIFFCLVCESNLMMSLFEKSYSPTVCRIPECHYFVSPSSLFRSDIFFLLPSHVPDKISVSTRR